jgi:hypothetical protein
MPEETWGEARAIEITCLLDSEFKGDDGAEWGRGTIRFRLAENTAGANHVVDVGVVLKVDNTQTIGSCKEVILNAALDVMQNIIKTHRGS